MQEVAVTMLEEWGPTVGLTFYVDDLTLETSGTPKDAAARCAAALDTVIDILENQMEFTVSEKKSVVVASQPVLAVAASDMTTSQKVTPARVAKLLGTATRAERGRAVNLLKVRKERFDKARSKYNALRG